MEVQLLQHFLSESLRPKSSLPTPAENQPDNPQHSQNVYISTRNLTTTAHPVLVS